MSTFWHTSDGIRWELVDRPSTAEFIALCSTLWSLELMHIRAYMDLRPFRYKMDDIFIMMKSPDSNNSAVWPHPTPIFSLQSSFITDLSVHYSDEKENLKMWALCVLPLKVLREHQVNIQWLASTERNLINMSSGCLLTVSFNALPTHTPTHTNKVQARANVHATQTNTGETRARTRAKSHTKTWPRTHARTHAHALPSRVLSRRAAPTGWAKITS